MNYNEFLEEYIPLIGTKVNDKYFNTAKLTKTAVLNKAVNIYFAPTILEAYREENANNIVYYLGKVINLAKMLGIPSRYYNIELSAPYLPFSLGNDKIGKDTLCISINTGLLCYMGLMGNCENCRICYAKSSNLMYTSEFVKNSISQRVFILYNPITLAMNTVKAVKQDLTKKQLNNLKFLRFNINGDVLNNQQLIKLNEVARILKNDLDLSVAYSYTHNKELDLSIAPDIVFNTSFRSNHHKNCLTAPMREEFKDNSKFIVCNGNCTNCSYCKDDHETRTIIFLPHGKGGNGVKSLSDDYRKELEENKRTDYLNFCKRIKLEV